MRILLLAVACSFLAAGDAASDPIELADIAGRYAFTADNQHEQWSHQLPTSSVGVLTIGADGSVSGTRHVKVFRTRNEMRIPESIMQTASGTISVTPEGLGTIVLAWEPAPAPTPMSQGTFPGAEACSLLHVDPTVVIDFVVHERGFELLQTETRTYVRDCPPPWDDGNVTTPGFHVDVLRGTAIRQGDPCPGASGGAPHSAVRRLR